MIPGTLTKFLHSGRMCSLDQNDATIITQKKLTYWV